MGMGVYFEWNAQVHTESYKDRRPNAAGTAPNCSKGKAAQFLFLLVFKGTWAMTADWTSSLVFAGRIASCSSATQITQHLPPPPVVPKMSETPATAVHPSNGSKKGRLKNDSSAVQTFKIERTAGVQKLTGSTTLFHCGNGCDRSC